MENYTTPQTPNPDITNNEVTSPSHKPKLIYVFIGLVILAIGIAGGYYLGKKSSFAKPTEASRISPSIMPTTTSQKPTEKAVEALDAKTFQDQVNHFTFQYPSDFEAEELTHQGRLLNSNIVISTNNISSKDCRGDCPVNETEEKVTLFNNLQATKIKGFVGGIGGNIPQSFIQYEIVNTMPNVTNKYISITLWELPQNIPYQEMIKEYPSNRINQPINIDKEQEFNQILSTFEFVK